MRLFLDKLLLVLHRLEDMVLVVLLLAMIVLAFTQIVLRNGFDGGFLWADALLRVLVLWIALLGAMVASREQRHISIDLIGRFLPPTGKRLAAVIAAAFTAVICAVLAWYCLDFVRMEYESPSPAFANVPTWLCESIMPVAFALIALRYLAHSLRIAFVGLPVEKSL